MIIISSGILFSANPINTQESLSILSIKSRANGSIVSCNIHNSHYLAYYYCSAPTVKWVPNFKNRMEMFVIMTATKHLHYLSMPQLIGLILKLIEFNTVTALKWLFHPKIHMPVQNQLQKGMKSFCFWV